MASSRLALVTALAVALTAPAAAQAPCPACTRGDALIDRFSLQPLRVLAADLATPLGDPLAPDQYARVVAIRERTPLLARLGAIDDDDLGAIAASLCHAASGPCVDATAHALRCLADRCEVALPHVAANHADILQLPPDCHQYSTHHRSPWYGLGVDWGNGWQRSKYPSDGGAWSFGIEARARLDRRFGTVARVDRIAGRDEATDRDHNGHDDLSTGAITRFTALAGPSIVLDNTRYEDTTRFLRLDLLGGYVATGSQPDESGPAAGVDLAYQLWVFRFGFRFVQGFEDARHATMLLAHLGILDGSAPPYDDEDDCGSQAAARSTRLAIGMDLPMLGYGLSSELGALPPGVGVEAVWHLTHRFDALAQADLLDYPGYHRDRVIHQAVMAGVRIDHQHKYSTTGFFTTVMAGYSHGIGFTPTSVGSGPVADISEAWGGQSDDGAGWIRLHARFGIGPDNVDYRALFISVGFELRLDPHRWRDRN